MELKRKKKKVDYGLALGGLEGQRRKVTSVWGRRQDEGGGVRVERRAGVEKLQPRLRSLDLSHQQPGGTLTSLPLLVSLEN